MKKRASRQPATPPTIGGRKTTESENVSRSKPTLTTTATRLAIRPEDRALLIRASAGTGKTFQLANRYISLLRTSEPDQILASTFTRKAAGEISERILLRLAEAASEATALASLATFTGQPKLTRKEVLGLLLKLTRQLHRLRISTLDGFFARLAGSFSLELRLAPGWRIMDDLEAEQLLLTAIDLVLREGDAQELQTLVHQLDQGGTRRSVHELISQQIKVFHLLYQSSPPEAWNQFGKLRAVKSGELESLADQLQAFPIQDSRTATARDADLERIANQAWGELLNKGLLPKATGDGHYYRKPLPAGLIELYQQLAEIVRTEWMLPWVWQTQATWQLLSRYNAFFQELQRESGGLRFNDLTRALAHSLSAWNTNELMHRLDGQIHHILLDEFQDTSLEQWRVLQPFADDVIEAADKSFYCVGDVKQAIYGWRGGEAAIFDTIRQQFPTVQEQPLNTSFRSSPVVIDVVNQIFRNLPRHNGFEQERAFLEKWASEFPQHATARTDYPGHFRLLTSPMPEAEEDQKPDARAMHAAFNRHVAELVQRQQQADPHGTIGILTRSNSKIAELIFELNQLGVEASEEGGNPLTDSVAVQLMLALMQLIDHPGDTVARFHVANSPLGTLLDYQNHQDHEATYRLAQQLRGEIVSFGFGRFVHDLTRRLAVHCNQRELRRLKQLCTLADNFDTLNSTLRTTEFVQFVQEQRVQEPTDARVRVMTIHQSKGLQFDTVYFVEADSLLTRPPEYYAWTPAPGDPPAAIATQRSKDLIELFPPLIRKACEQTLERNFVESLCVLYVALTRAIFSLQVVIQPRNAKSAEKTFPKTSAGLIRAALAPELPNTPETVLYETGDPDWFKHRPSTTSEAEQAAPTPRTLQIRFPQRPPKRRLVREAPSLLEGSREVTIFEVLGTGGRTAALRGTLFHAWVEQISWLDAGLPEESTLRAIGRSLGIAEEELDVHLQEFNRMLQRAEIRKLLSRQTYLTAAGLDLDSRIRGEILAAPVEIEVQNERRFGVLIDGKLLTGSIDRLVIIQRAGAPIAAEVIDFKTDQLEKGLLAMTERKEKYRQQLACYQQATAQFLNLDPTRISTRLVFL